MRKMSAKTATLMILLAWGLGGNAAPVPSPEAPKSLATLGKGKGQKPHKHKKKAATKALAAREKNSFLFAPRRRNAKKEPIPVIHVQEPKDIGPIPEPAPVIAPKPKPEQIDTITFSSAYFPALYTNAQLANAGLEMVRLGSRMEGAVHESPVARWSVRFLSLWVEQAFARSYNEIGQGLRAKAFGCSYSLQHGGEVADVDSCRVGFFSFFAQSLVRNDGSDCFIPEEQGKTAGSGTSTRAAAGARAYAAHARAGAGPAGVHASSPRVVRSAGQERRQAGEEGGYGPSQLAELILKVGPVKTREWVDKIQKDPRKYADTLTTEQLAIATPILREASTTPIADTGPAAPGAPATPAIVAETVGSNLTTLMDKVTAQVEIAHAALQAKVAKGGASPEDTAKLAEAKALVALTKDPTFRKEVAAAAHVTSVAVKESGRELLSVRQLLIIHLGGYNNSIYLAERQSEQIYERGDVTFAEGVSYYLAYCSAFGYNRIGKNAFDFCRCVDDLGFEIQDKQRQEIGTYTAIASFTLPLLSSTTWHILHAILEQFADDEPRALWEPLGFRLPDVFLYFTSKGFSVKVNSGWRLNRNFRLIFGIEHALGVEKNRLKPHIKKLAEKYGYGGEDDMELIARHLDLEDMLMKPTAKEFHVGLQHTLGEALNDITYRGVFTFGSGLCFEGELQLPIEKRWSVGFGGATYATSSLVGERLAPDLRDKRSGNVFISLSYRY
ncbi:MAG: hypothetical protein LBJ70_01885 [Holosporales bacterium]|nr:hypothetical protein [Holosporales bacterium]